MEGHRIKFIETKMSVASDGSVTEESSDVLIFGSPITLDDAILKSAQIGDASGTLVTISGDTGVSIEVKDGATITVDPTTGKLSTDGEVEGSSVVGAVYGD